MKLLVKKDKNNINGVVTLEHLADVLGLNSLLEKINTVETSSKKFLTKKEVVALYIEFMLNNGNAVNITSVASIEKNKKVKNGTMYYNKTKDSVRIKLKTGWTNLK